MRANTERSLETIYAACATRRFARKSNFGRPAQGLPLLDLWSELVELRSEFQRKGKHGTIGGCFNWHQLCEFVLNTPPRNVLRIIRGEIVALESQYTFAGAG
jgi:hypothetical protein